MSDDFQRLDVIAKHLRALTSELDGFDRNLTRVGQALIRTDDPARIKGRVWPAVWFTVRDDRGETWQFKVAISPAGRSARIVDVRESDGRIHWGSA